MPILDTDRSEGRLLIDASIARDAIREAWFKVSISVDWI
jgi:hypothetical protein